MIEDYILERTELVCLFVLLDSRLEPQRIDLEFIEWLGEEGIPFALVFTKADKLSKGKLAANIEDEPNNTTRFLVLGHQDTTPSGKDKTSLVVSAPNHVGMLHRVIEPLTRAGISLTKFESRPSRTAHPRLYAESDDKLQYAHLPATQAKNRQFL